MRISGKNRSALYTAFSSRITDLRIELKSDPRLDCKEALDARLFKLESQIWIDIKKTLKI